MSKVTVLPLTYTFRCPKAVVAAANQFVADLEAAPTNAEGEVVTLDSSEFHKTSVPSLQATDAILCRNTAPLVELAFSLIRQGIGCKVEGRDIGAALIKLIERFKNVTTLDALQDRVQAYQLKEVSKLLQQEKEQLAEAINDRCDTVLVLIDAVQGTKGYRASLNGLRQYIEDLFGDAKDDTHPILTLSTIHKSKGREWPHVYILGANRYQPSPFARKEWQMEQEDNLSYVSITRSQDRLTYINVPIKPRA